MRELPQRSAPSSTSYGNTVHSFTNPEADGSIPGICYNKQADERSWQAMRAFFDEIFA